MISHNPFIVNVGFESWCKYPEGGYLVFPYELLRKGKALTHTFAAWWAMYNGPRPIFTPSPLARNGCLPLGTLREHLAKIGLERCYTDRGLEYVFSRHDFDWLACQFSPTAPHVQVPRIWFHYWPDMPLTERLLLGLYRFKCVAPWGKLRACTLSHSQIADWIGFNRLTWQRASAGLAKRGLIVRERTSRGYAVTLPDSNCVEFQ